MNDNHKTNGFWRHQFTSQSTSGQNFFDWTVGVILPIVCLVIDPIVFRSPLGILEFGYYSTLQVFAYAAIILGISTLAFWLAFRKRIGLFIGLVTGILFVGTLFSFVVGIVLVRFSLLGLIAFSAVGYLYGCLGIFGFTPFFTAFVFLRNGFRSYQYATDRMNRRWLVSSMLLSIILVTAIPFFAHQQASRLVTNAIKGVMENSPESADRAKQNFNNFKAAIPGFTYWHTSEQVAQLTQEMISGDTFSAERTALKLHRLQMVSGDWQNKHNGVISSLIVEEIVKNEKPTDELIRNLEYMSWCNQTCYYQIWCDYRTEKARGQHKRFELIYKKLTGNDITEYLYAD